jgi:hypothetical protein|tara:strand:+ start:17532 stop:18071 length:540 start_codon:yes stop_codon:yes gene_type:complete
MKLKVLRFSSQVDSTSGILMEETDLGLSFLCYTLEDEKRALKVRGETRVPAGKFNLTLRTVGGLTKKYEKRFPDIHKGMLWVRDVPNFEYILIHCGNTDDHSAGCLLLGDSQENNIIIKDGYIGKSSKAYQRIYPRVAKHLENGGEATIEYIDLDSDYSCIKDAAIKGCSNLMKNRRKN